MIHEVQFPFQSGDTLVLQSAVISGRLLTHLVDATRDTLRVQRSTRCQRQWGAAAPQLTHLIASAVEQHFSQRLLVSGFSEAFKANPRRDAFGSVCWSGGGAPDLAEMEWLAASRLCSAVRKVQDETLS